MKYHSNETSLTELLHSSFYFPGFSKNKIEFSRGFLLWPLLVARVNSQNFWNASTVTRGSNIWSDYLNAWNLFSLVVMLILLSAGARFGTETYWGSQVDLLQVDLLASGASIVWPRSGRPRATKSREVDLSRLMVFYSPFCAKNGEWRDSHLGFSVSFTSPWLQYCFNGGMCWFHSD